MDMGFIPLYDKDSSIAIDKMALKTCELSSVALIRRAAERSLVALLERWPSIKSIAVFCGTGNNGADGLVLALLAKKIGMRVSVHLVGDGSPWGLKLRFVRRNV